MPPCRRADAHFSATDRKTWIGELGEVGARSGRRTSRLRLSVVAVVAVLAGQGLPGTAAAQPDSEPEERIRILVTGSRIPQIDGETALPVQIITREEILRGNWSNAREILANLPANIGGENIQTSIGNSFSPGLESANLRGIGDGNTLVLLNGRRLSNYAFLSGTVNLGSIPVAALDRVEILKDGASSVYGTEAIAGVINFITRKDYTGLDLVGQAGITEHGGGDHYQATMTAGWGSLAKDRVNAFVTFDWQKDKALASIDRWYSATAYWPGAGINRLSEFSTPANIPVGDTTWLNPGYATGCRLPRSIPATSFHDITGEMCLFDYAAVSKIIPDAERWTVLARSTWQVASDHQLVAEYLYARTQLTLEFTPTPVVDEFHPFVVYPADGPYYPTAYAAANGLSGPLPILYRTIDLGPRTDVVTTEAQRAVVGAQGLIGEWSYSLGYNYSQNQADDDYTKGYVRWSQFIPAMATGLINPWGPNTQAGLDLLASTQYIGPARTAKGTMHEADLEMTREWFSLPGGPVGIALGGEWRRELLSDRPEPFLGTFDVVGAGFGVNPQDESRTVGALFAELDLPLTKEIEVLGSVRYDHYSDFGGTTNPKVGVRWQPLKTLLFRAAWGTGFRAPLLIDLYTPQQTVLTDPANDPVRCPVTRAPGDCSGTFNYVVGGNPNLQPETSTQETAGAIWAPSPGWSFGAQWWHIDKRDQIFALGDPQFILDNQDLFGAYVIRGPVDPAYPTLPGPVTTIIDINQNYGTLKTSGVDFSVRAQAQMGALGNLSFAFDGTYVYQFEDQLPGFPATSWLGVNGAYGPIPRWRQYGQLNWQYGPWSATISQSFQAGVIDGRPDPEGHPRHMGSYTQWDLQGVYTGLANTSIALGVRNFFNTDPPFSNSARFNYVPSVANPRGRTLYGRISYSFK
jgi:iron complex outermembrane receptor protein